MEVWKGTSDAQGRIATLSSHGGEEAMKTTIVGRRETLSIGRPYGTQVVVSHPGTRETQKL